MEFKEHRIFSKLIGEFLTDAEYAGLQNELVDNPEKGKIIKGTGGARKIRAAAKGHGKSGGLRVIYYFQAENTIHFLAVYPKNEKEELSSEDRKWVASIIQSIKEDEL